MGASALHLIEQHGYLGLYISLALGLLGIPIPDETLLTFTGYLVFRGQLGYVPVVLVAVLGSLTGMSLSYWIGRLVGTPFIHRYGKYMHITPERIEKEQIWFHKYGAKSIIFGYFLPGLRHLTAYISGISKFNFSKFMATAAIGSTIWAVLFITLGRVIGEDWAMIGRLTHRYLGFLVVVAALVIIIGMGLWNEKHNKL
jgi:membrane protein DedA with SNARE-associated domain